MKLILSKRLCCKNLIPAGEITAINIGDLFIKVDEGQKISDGCIYILASVGVFSYALINTASGVRYRNRVESSKSITTFDQKELKQFIVDLCRDANNFFVIK